MLASTGREARAGGVFRWGREALPVAPLRFSTECRGREHKQPNRTQPAPALSNKAGEPEGAKEAGANCARELEKAPGGSPVLYILLPVESRPDSQPFKFGMSVLS